MLEQRDLEAIALLLDKKLEKNNEQMKSYIEERFAENDKRLEERFKANNQSMKEFVREQITNSESFLLEEMERMYNSTNTKIEFLQKNISELTQYYKITKLENDNTALLLQMITRLQEDVEELKKKTA